MPLSGAPCIFRAHIRSAIRSDGAVLWPERVWRSCAVGSLDVWNPNVAVLSGVGCRPLGSGRRLWFLPYIQRLRSGAVDAAEDLTGGDGEDEADGSAA